MRERFCAQKVYITFSSALANKERGKKRKGDKDLIGQYRNSTFGYNKDYNPEGDRKMFFSFRKRGYFVRRRS